MNQKTYQIVKTRTEKQSAFVFRKKMSRLVLPAVLVLVMAGIGLSLWFTSEAFLILSFFVGGAAIILALGLTARRARLRITPAGIFLERPLRSVRKYTFDELEELEFRENGWIVDFFVNLDAPCTLIVANAQGDREVLRLGNWKTKIEGVTPEIVLSIVDTYTRHPGALVTDARASRAISTSA